jgi:hypothetical protein
VLRADHVANGVLRKPDAEPILRLARVAAADGVHGDHEILVGVVGLAGPDQRRVAGAHAAGAVRHENCVGLAGVELAVGGVANFHAGELLAILEGEFRNHVHGVLRRDLRYGEGQEQQGA